MNLIATACELDKLSALYVLREQRALEAISEQRIEVDRVVGRLNEQLELIRSLRAELADLHERRSSSNIQNITVQSLQVESERRRWLIYDLDQELFYLSGFKSDVDEAKAELLVRQRAWTHARERTKLLANQVGSANSQIRRVKVRREDAVQDNRKPTGRVMYG